MSEEAAAEQPEASVPSARAAALTVVDNDPRAPIDRRPPRQPIRPQGVFKGDAGAVSEHGPFHPSLSLHPDCVTKLTIDGHPVSNDNTAGYLAPVAELFKSVTAGLEAVGKARADAAQNSAWTPAQQILKVGDMAMARQTNMTKAVDSMRTRLEAQLRSFDEVLNQPIREAATADSNVGSDICRHFKELPNVKARTDLIDEAFENDDRQTLTSLLARPAYLSGMAPQMHAICKREFAKRLHPQEAERHGAVSAVLKLLNERSWLVVTEVERALGVKWTKFNRIKNANSLAEQSLIASETTG